MDKTEEIKRVAETVRRAFRGVTLGDGIGLRQAEGLDSYADSATLEVLRSSDEKRDWSRIPSNDLNTYCNSLSYFDAEGMRFHLPAYLLAELNDELEIEFVFHLVCTGHDTLSHRFHLLDASQRDAVRAFLRLQLINADFQREMIQSTLDTYWSDPAPC